MCYRESTGLGAGYSGAAWDKARICTVGIVQLSLQSHHQLNLHILTDGISGLTATVVRSLNNMKTGFGRDHFFGVAPTSLVGVSPSPAGTPRRMLTSVRERVRRAQGWRWFRCRLNRYSRQGYLLYRLRDLKGTHSQEHLRSFAQ